MDPLYNKYNKALQYKVLTSLCFLLIVASSIAFMVNYSRQGFNIFATIDITLFFMYLICLYFMHKQGVRSWNKVLIVYSYIVVILLMTVIGKLNAGILNWVFTIPLMLYILYLKRHAFITSLIVMLFEIVNLYHSENYGQTESFVGVPNFFLSYVLIWLLAALYMTHNSKIKQRLTYHATQDPLTGALNRLSLKQHVESYNYNNPISICLLDIDYFKQINDKYGHGIGDQVLILLVKIISQETSALQVYRVGGEEFVILFNDELSTGIKKAEEILAAVNSYNYNDIHHELTLSFSAGITKIHHNESLSDVLKRADNYLYQAKNSGRNTIMSELNEA